MQTSETRAARLVLTHHGFVMALALRLAPWPGLADDITQQVFLEFLAKEEKWDLQSDLKPLLATMTRHVAMRHWRQRMHHLPEVTQQLADYIRDLAGRQEIDCRWEDELAALRRCQEKLPARGRELIDLYYFRGFSTVDIAGQTGVKSDAICQALCRLRGKLRQCIERTLGKGAHV